MTQQTEAQRLAALIGRYRSPHCGEAAVLLLCQDELLKQALEALELVTTEMLAIRDELAERGGRPKINVFHQRLWDSSFRAYVDHAIPIAESIRAHREAK